jgi:hypothetical protein
LVHFGVRVLGVRVLWVNHLLICCRFFERRRCQIR